MLIPSTVDDTLAPAGRARGEPLLPALPLRACRTGRTWDDERDRAADAVIDHVNALRAQLSRRRSSGERALSPSDLEREFGLVGGDIFHGKLTLNQLFSARPVLGYADYRMPVRGLYLCGSGAHPGGGVTGAPGHNAAREILRDLGRRR